MSAATLRTERGRLRWRPLAKLWHRWFGLAAGLWLFLLALTGCVITFYDELDIWLNPDLRRAPAVSASSPSPTPVADAVAAARRAVPGFEPGMINLPQEPGASIWMLGRAEGRAVQVFADPRGGAVFGWRESGKLSVDRRHVMDVFYGLHIDLLLGPWVTWFFGLVGLLWLIDHIIAVVLAVPKASLWFDAFRIKGRARSFRRLFDLHRAPGMWLWPVTAVLALTGMTLAWPQASRDVVRLASPVSERLHEGFPETTVADPIPIDTAIALGAQGKRLHSVRPIADHGVYAVRTFHPSDLDDQGRLWTYVSMTDGRILARRHDNGTSAGDGFFAWQYPLHSGKAFGWPGRIAVFLGGLATAALCWTGVLLWWRRRG